MRELTMQQTEVVAGGCSCWWPFGGILAEICKIAEGFIDCSTN